MILKGALREAFQWFSQKADLFAGEFTKSAGKTMGASAGVAAGLTITGQMPRLISLVERILRQTR